ncbi:SDR family oxidoreductase [Saccharopolyspora indica]|uniref:SDR family NAD(P)-dependent oxidoreductase n=1 Tax=Saccharopolyspora indica TaxID=1229659 RepID=UPI0022EB384C|nr:SDR family NAD(P)-dependent oxidoreductase [Saccharopolyspora indica]MDA3644235.1 SDR family NAD(P)-dependent oxidoreductase [Saccharopolyspora indica]
MTKFPAAEAASIGELVDLSGKTALVVGGAMGIGLGIVRRLHEAGANVVVSDINGAAAEQAVAEFAEADRLHAVVGDVSDPADAEAMVRAAVDRFGALDIFVNNAGIYGIAPFLELDLETARRTLEVNLLGVMACSQAAARQMIAQGSGGRIIVVSSIESLTPSLVGMGHYGASKHGVAGLLKTMALELAPHGISVNSVAPGGIRTPGLGPLDDDVLDAFEAVVPMGRMGVPDEIGRVALFLASDLATYMTGTQVVVDGGRTLRGAAV